MLKSIFGGIAIGIAGLTYLMCSNAIVGTFLFSVGLYIIMSFNLGLYTGSVGYIVEKKDKLKYAIKIAIIWIGNFLGCWLFSNLLKLTSRKTQITYNLSSICTFKMNENAFTTLFLSVMCGILMFVSVHMFKTNTGAERYIGMFICVPAFIMCQFEHSVANMFFLTLNEKGFGIGADEIPFIAICAIGNAIGAIFIAGINGIIRKERGN